MAATSFLQIMHLDLKALAFTKFSSALGLSTITEEAVYFPKDIAMREVAERKGKVVASFINLWCVGTEFAWERQRTSVGRRGMTMVYDDVLAKTAITTVKSVPVNLTYNLWVWSLSLDKVLQAVEAYMFWVHSDPNLDLTLDLGSSDKQFPLEFDLHFGEAVDEAPVASKYDKGVYYVTRLPIVVDGWVFSNFDLKTIKEIYLKVYDDLLEDYSKNVLLLEWEHIES